MKMLPLLGTLLGLAIICLLFMLLSNAAVAQQVKYNSPFVEKPVDLKRMSSALKAVENTPRYYVGYAGERSEFQITEDVWNQHSKMPHEWASGNDPICVDETLKVVRKHLEWIVRKLEKGEWTASPYTIACIWKGGWGRWEKRKLRFSDTSYAVRAMNVYSDTTP